MSNKSVQWCVCAIRWMQLAVWLPEQDWGKKWKENCPFQHQLQNHGPVFTSVKVQPGTTCLSYSLLPKCAFHILYNLLVGQILRARADSVLAVLGQLKYWQWVCVETCIVLFELWVLCPKAYNNSENLDTKIQTQNSINLLLILDGTRMPGTSVTGVPLLAPKIGWVKTKQWAIICQKWWWVFHVT